MEFTRSVFSRLRSFFEPQPQKTGFKDLFSSMLRRTSHLAKLNIVYLTAMLTPPLNTLAGMIPCYSWPLLGDLPVAKVQSKLYYCYNIVLRFFRNQENNRRIFISKFSIYRKTLFRFMAKDLARAL